MTDDRIAGFLYDINLIQLGTYGAMGVQEGIGLPGGGDLHATGANPNPYRTGVFTLSDGGALQAAAHREAHVQMAATGGGDLQIRTPTGLLVPVSELILERPTVGLGAPPAPIPAGLLITLGSTVLDIAPGALIAFVGNGTPEGEVAFTVDDGSVSTPALSTTFDDSGAVGGISVPISVSVEGTYSLVATDVTTSLTASAAFTVTAVAAPVTIGVPVTTPPPSVQPGSGVRKWVFQDPATGDVYHFPINPNKMNSPFAPKRITFQATTAIDGAKIAFEGQSAPVDWAFSGTLFDKAQYDAFTVWLAKRNRIWVTDHYGRAWLCYLTHYDPQPRRDVGHAWCHDWSMSALIFEGPVTPA